MQPSAGVHRTWKPVWHVALLVVESKYEQALHALILSASLTPPLIPLLDQIAASQAALSVCQGAYTAAWQQTC